MISKVRPHIKDFIELNGDPKEALKILKNLKSNKGIKSVIPAKEKLVELYCPWSNEFYLGYISRIREKERDEKLDANIEMKLVASKHDTRATPIPIGLDEYERLKEEGGLISTYHLYNVLSCEQRLKYYLYEEKEVEVLSWME